MSSNTWLVAGGAGLLAVALVLMVIKYPALLTSSGISSHLPYKGDQENALPLHPMAELLKLVIATLVGIMVTAVHKRYHRDRPLPRSLQQAQILLCVAGALVMVIIGNSMARAFGVLGAAGIVRFRTPVEDPKDTTILFLMIGLGMACGVGLIEVAGMGTVFLCLVLAVLDRFGEAKARVVVLSLVATSKDFPNEHVHNILTQSVHFFEPREVIHGNEAVVRYNVTMDPNVSLSHLSQQ
ncbi:MAG: DUF4956 domain-containing protein, partial [Acidobacteria bacterium]|nr:DUF4956 domain-containing protein [Acidobacteriota bacterium]